jgi:hypothetical protein
MKRFSTIKQRELPPNEVMDCKKLEDGSMWFQLKLHKASGRLKKIIYIIDFTVTKNELKVIKANGTEEDGYVWIEQNWKTLESTKDFALEVSKIWNKVYGDKWPINIDDEIYRNLDFGDLLYAWQVLVKKPNLSLTVNELGWFEEIMKMNSMYSKKNSAKNGSSLPSIWGARGETHISLRSKEINDIDASNVKSQMNWTKSQYSAVKELKLTAAQSTTLVELNNRGYQLDWISDMYKLYGIEFLSKKSIVTYRIRRRPRNYEVHSYGRILNYIENINDHIDNNTQLSDEEKERWKYKIIPAKLLTTNSSTGLDYCHYLKDWLNYTSLMNIKIKGSDIPRGDETVEVDVTMDRIVTTSRVRYKNILKMKALHDKVYKDFKIVKDQIQEQKFKDTIENVKSRYEKIIGNYSFVLPSEPNDLVVEGNNLNHCVAGYVSAVANGNSVIVFMRNTNNVGKSLITIEVMGNRLIQARGSSNRNPNRGEKVIINKWLKTL